MGTIHSGFSKKWCSVKNCSYCRWYISGYYMHDYLYCFRYFKHPIIFVFRKKTLDSGRKVCYGYLIQTSTRYQTPPVLAQIKKAHTSFKLLYHWTRNKSNIMFGAKCNRCLRKIRTMKVLLKNMEQ